jgi:hypothetical protein
MTSVYDYDEVTYGLSSSPSSSNWSSIDPLYKWDTHFPERYSRLELNPDYPLNVSATRKKRVRCRNAARFKTQPITFDEIKEVDDEEPDPNREGIKSQFQAFSRSMDGLVPAGTSKDFDGTPRSKPLVIDATISNLQQTTPSNSDDALVEPASRDGSCDSPKEKKETDWVSGSLGMSHELARARRRRSKKSQHRKTIHDIPEVEKEKAQEATT